MSDQPKPDASVERCAPCGMLGGEHRHDCTAQSAGRLKAELAEARAEVEQLREGSAIVDNACVMAISKLESVERERDHHRETLRLMVDGNMINDWRHREKWLRERDPWLFEGDDDD